MSAPPPGRERRPAGIRAADVSASDLDAPTVRRRRVLEVEVESRYCARLRGYGSRDLIVELKGRPPLWSPSTRAWTVSERTARDVVALAESRGFDIVVVGPRAVAQSQPLEDRPAGAPVDAALW